MKITFQRIFKNGFLNFRRNSWLSLATVSIFSLTLFMLLSLLFFSMLGTAMLDFYKNKIDISVYFSTEAPEDQILKIKDAVASLQGVKKIEYVSRDEALNRFQERHAENSVLMQAIRELGANPLQASMNIKTNEVSDYEVITTFLSREEFKNIVDKVDYYQNKDTIVKLDSLIGIVRRSVLGITLFLSLIAILVAFNTIRLAIYTSKEEISIMRLVGASNWYIRGPFIFTGALYGAVASILVMAVTYPLVLYFSSKIANFMELTTSSAGTEQAFSLAGYFNQNFFELFLILVGAGILLGVISSFIAIRRYLKV